MELTRIAVLTGEEVSKERLALTVAELVDMKISPDHLKAAFRMARQECKFFPRPAAINEFVKREKSKIQIPTKPGGETA